MRMTRRWRMAVASVAVAGGLTMGTQAQTLSVTNGLLVRLESTAGVTVGGSGTGMLTGWVDQSGHSKDFSTVNTTSGQRPLFDGVTPNGRPAVRFPRFGANQTLNRVNDVDFDAMTNAFTWALVLKPTPSGADEVYVNHSVDGRAGAANLMYVEYNKWYLGSTRTMVPSDTTYRSTLPTNDLGVAATKWMIMTLVFDRGETLRIMSKDQDGNVVEGSLIPSATMQGGTHIRTRLGANQDGNSPTAMQLAAVLMYTNALSSTDRLAVETYLYDTYIRLPPKGTVVMIR